VESRDRLVALGTERTIVTAPNTTPVTPTTASTLLGADIR
jgi:hypothetical protein